MSNANTTETSLPASYNRYTTFTQDKKGNWNRVPVECYCHFLAEGDGESAIRYGYAVAYRVEKTEVPRERISWRTLEMLDAEFLRNAYRKANR